MKETTTKDEMTVAKILAIPVKLLSIVQLKLVEADQKLCR